MKLKPKYVESDTYDVSNLSVKAIQELKEGPPSAVEVNVNTLKIPHAQITYGGAIHDQFPNIKNIKECSSYLSIKKEIKFPEFKDFNLITGLNGGGKTHLLKAIEHGHIIVEIDNKKVDVANVAFFDYLSFMLSNENSVTFNFENLKLQTKNHFESAINHVANLNLFSKNNRSDLLQEWMSNKNNLTSEAITKFNKYFKSLSLVRNIGGQNHQQQEPRYSYQDVFGTREDAHNIDENDIHQAIMSLKDKNNYLTDGFSILFRAAQTELDKIIHEQNLKPTDAEAEYKTQFGHEVPWEYLNKIFKNYCSSDFEYKFLFEKPKENLSEPLKASLVDKNSGEEVEYQNLSSGEKVLLTLSLFILQRSLSDKFPKVLLLDEIDTTLHPSLSQNLVTALKKNFIEVGIKIIFATHSVSTIAFCDESEDGIFLIENSNKVSSQPKSRAINVLSSGIISLDQGNSMLDLVLSKKDKELFIITEGNNINYLQHCSNLFLTHEEKQKIEFIQDVENVSGAVQLKTLFEFFEKINHKKKIIFVWDCDCLENKKIRELTDNNNVFPFIFEQNNSNNIALRGIENLFPEDQFEGYINETRKSNGDIHKVFDKRKKEFEESLLKLNNDRKIFENFKPLYNKIKHLLN